MVQGIRNPRFSPKNGGFFVLRSRNPEPIMKDKQSAPEVDMD